MKKHLKSSRWRDSAGGRSLCPQRLLIGKRLTKANVDEVTKEWPKKQVESILGPPTSIDSTDLAGYEEDDLHLPAGQRIGHDRLFQTTKCIEGKHAARIAVVRGPDETTSVPAELERKMDEAIGHYPAEQKRSAAMPLLHLWQEHFGFISDEGVSWIAAKLGLSRSTFSSWSRSIRCSGRRRPGKNTFAFAAR